MNQQEKQEFLDRAKDIMAATLGKKEALRKLNEVATVQLTLKKSTADRAGDETREDESTPYSPPKGGEKAGREECSRCLGEGRVPQFEGRENAGGLPAM
jgi:hypothetical protein